MFCEQCGAEVTAVTQFCEGCGALVAAVPKKPSQTSIVQEAKPLGEAPCYYCTKLIPAGALNCPSCGRERYLSQAPTVQEATSLGEAPCYYCTKLIPTGALNCPSCGKERKELYELKLKARSASIAGLVFSFVFVVMFFGVVKERRSTSFGELDAIEMFNDPVLWLLFSLFVIAPLVGGFARRRYQQRYAELSGGKKMVDFGSG